MFAFHLLISLCVDNPNLKKQNYVVNKILLTREYSSF